MDKHTPGPWFVEPLEGKYYGSVVRIGDGKVKVWQPLGTNYTASDREIAKGWDTECGFDHVETQESYKTAILIAAAPETAAERDKLKEINAELLHAIETLLGETDDSYYMLQAERESVARAAIYKAKDRTEQKENRQ